MSGNRLSGQKENNQIDKKIQELREKILGNQIELSVVLRETKEVLVGSDHKDVEFLAWLSNEIDGYKHEMSAPDYRNARGHLKCDNGVKIVDVFFEDGNDIPPKKILSTISEVEIAAKNNGFKICFNSNTQSVLQSDTGIVGTYFMDISLGEANRILEAVKSELLSKLNAISAHHIIYEEKYGVEVLHNEVREKCIGLFNDGHYKNAAEESFKVVKDKIRHLTGSEKPHESFGKGKGLYIKGAAAENVDDNFNKGVKFLIMAISYFRNERTHTSEGEINKKKGFHYLMLSSLALMFLDSAEAKREHTYIYTNRAG